MGSPYPGHQAQESSNGSRQLGPQPHEDLGPPATHWPGDKSSLPSGRLWVCDAGSSTKAGPVRLGSSGETQRSKARAAAASRARVGRGVTVLSGQEAQPDRSVRFRSPRGVSVCPWRGSRRVYAQLPSASARTGAAPSSAPHSVTPRWQQAARQVLRNVQNHC